MTVSLGNPYVEETKAPLALLAVVTAIALGLVAGTVMWDLWDEAEPWGTAGARIRETTMPPAGATESSREEIAKGHSRHRRQLNVRFGCETLGSSVAPVWRHMNLRVRMADEQGLHLAECTRPERPATVSIPLEVARIAVTAPGYKPKVVSIPATSEPATVLLEPDALVRVRARNLPRGPGNRFACTARLATGLDHRGRPVLGSRISRRQPTRGAPDRGLTWRFKIPSGVPARFHVARTDRQPGDHSGFLGLKSPVITLTEGESREIILDLSDCGGLEGRLTGVPQQALEGQVLTVKITGEIRPHGAGSEAGPIRLDVGGGFRVAGLADPPVSLRLWTQGGESIALREVGSGRRQWRAGGCGFLVLEPAVAIHGVVPAKEGRILELPFHVQTGGPPGSRSSLGRRIPLFTREKLQQAPLFFLVEGIGHFQANLRGKLPDADGLHRVEVPVPGGSLIVRVQNQPEKGVCLVARTTGSPGGPGGITGTRTSESWCFEGLPPGEYELLVSFDTRKEGGRHVHSGRVLARTVAVGSEQETRVTVRMPEVLAIPGRVTNWSASRTATAPGWLRLHHGGELHSAPIDEDGSFEFMVLGPWEGAREVAFHGRRLLADIKSTDVTWLPARKQLLVAFPGVRLRWLAVRPADGGRIWAHVYPTGARRGRRLHARDGRIPIQDLPDGVEGIVCEELRRHHPHELLVRGWFRLAPGRAGETQTAFKGRPVQVAMAESDQEATLSLVPPSWWQRSPPAWAALRLEGSRPRRLWLPAGAAAVLVDGRRKIPASEIGDRLVIDPR